MKCVYFLIEIYLIIAWFISCLMWTINHVSDSWAILLHSFQSYFSLYPITPITFKIFPSHLQSFCGSLSLRFQIYSVSAKRFLFLSVCMMNLSYSLCLNNPYYVLTLFFHLLLSLLVFWKIACLFSSLKNLSYYPSLRNSFLHLLLWDSVYCVCE